MRVYELVALSAMAATSGDGRQIKGGQESRRRAANVWDGVDDAGGRREYGADGVIAVRVFEFHFTSDRGFTGKDRP